MSLFTTLALTHQLFRLDCYIPNQGMVYRYLKIGAPTVASKVRKNTYLIQNLLLDSPKNITFDELKNKDESYRVCHIQASVHVGTPAAASGSSDLFINLDFYNQLSPNERQDLMADAKNLDQITEDQEDAQIEALKLLYANELKAKAFPELRR